MKYLVELMEKEKPEADKGTIEYVLSFLIKEGHLSYTVQYHYDIYNFYLKCLDHYNKLELPPKCARQDTIQHYKISRRLFFNIVKEFSA